MNKSLANLEIFKLNSPKMSSKNLLNYSGFERGVPSENYKKFNDLPMHDPKAWNFIFQNR